MENEIVLNEPKEVADSFLTPSESNIEKIKKGLKAEDIDLQKMKKNIKDLIKSLENLYHYLEGV